MPFAGLDVIAYRAFKLKSIDGNRVRLSVSVKAYSVDMDTHLQGLPKGATLEQLEAQGDGELELVKGEVLARKSDVREQLVLVFQAPNAAPAPDPADPMGQAQPPGSGTLTAQMQTQATLVRGEDLRAALKGASHDPSHAAP
jgi:hypothetical protein